MKNYTVLVVIIGLLLTASAAFPSKIFGGYGYSRWGTSFHVISKTYRNGSPGRIGNQLIYKQTDPDKSIRQRTFAFRNDGLNAVSITFSPSYVSKTGVEKILNQLSETYGEPTMDRSSAPHLVSYSWEDALTRITFAFSAQGHEMTVLMFQQKNN